MNLYLIKRVEEPDWDEMGAMVIAAESQADALEFGRFDGAKITIKQIGIAHPDVKSGVVCEDYKYC